MAGERQSLGRPSLGAGDMQIEDRQRHRQALAALDDAHEVGVLQIVVGLAVAAIGVGARDHLGEGLGRGAAPVDEVGEIGRHRRHLLAEGREIDRLVTHETAQQEARLEKIDPFAVAGAQIPQSTEIIRHASLRRLPDVGQMAWPHATDQHRIEAHRAGGIARMMGDEQAGRPGDPAELPRAQRVGRRGEVAGAP